MTPAVSPCGQQAAPSAGQRVSAARRSHTALNLSASLPRPPGATAGSGCRRPHPRPARGAGSDRTCRAPPREARPSCREATGRARPPAPRRPRPRPRGASRPSRPHLGAGATARAGRAGPGRRALRGAQTVPAGQTRSPSSEPGAPPQAHCAPTRVPTPAFAAPGRAPRRCFGFPGGSPASRAHLRAPRSARTPSPRAPPPGPCAAGI